jgi:hypothetical protein
MSEASKYFDFIAVQPIGVQFLDRNDERALQFLGYLTAPTKQGTTGVLAGLICYDDVGAGFVKNALNDADYLVLNIFNKKLIGFACVRYYHEPDGSTYYYIELICNLSPPPYELRSMDEVQDPRLGGNAIISEIERKAQEAGCEFVKLKAIEKVISYYARLGYMFPGVNTSDKLKEATALIQALRRTQVKAKSEERDPENDPEANKIYEQIAIKYYPGYFSEGFQQSLTQTDPELRIKEAVKKIKLDGIPMIKYLNHPPVLQPPLVPIPRPSFGGKKRRKTKSVPRRYIPKGLTKKDKKKQREMLKKSRKMYKKGKYYTRRKVKSFKSKKSNHITKAQKIYKIDKIYPGKELANKTGCSVNALKKIVKKGEGAYFSSGSRPNQTAQSWGYARLASAITGGKSAAVDYNILENGCEMESEALRLAKKAKRRHGYGRGKTPQVKI